jgi:hypothetical protein
LLIMPNSSVFFIHTPFSGAILEQYLRDSIVKFYGKKVFFWISI